MISPADLDLAELADVWPHPIFVTHPDGELLLANQALRRITPEPRNLRDVLAPESRSAMSLMGRLEDKPIRVSVKLRDGSGGIINLVPHQRRGIIMGVIRPASDPASGDAEKLEGVIQMARALGHELNQPLTVILGQAEILLLRLGQDEDVRKRLETIIAEVERMEETTRKLSRIVRYATQTYADGTAFVDLDKSTDPEA